MKGFNILYRDHLKKNPAIIIHVENFMIKFINCNRERMKYKIILNKSPFVKI